MRDLLVDGGGGVVALEVGGGYGLRGGGGWSHDVKVAAGSCWLQWCLAIVSAVWGEYEFMQAVGGKTYR